VTAALVPELYVSDVETSLAFYAALGFDVRYARPEERFAYLQRDGAELMLEEPRGRVWLTGPLKQPFSRGVNLQIAVVDADALSAARPASAAVILPIEIRDYRRAADTITVRQFVLADPDGYLLRFSQLLGATPAYRIER
jgi:catechol 2,3-dioxygenase-like lactoylglutathione lyase family enzyme